MKNFFLKTLALSILPVVGVNEVSAQVIHSKVDVGVFPKPAKGMTQYVIEVPFSSMEVDATKKVELIIGKNTEVDKCNRFGLAGTLEKKDLQGFGYNYYEFKTDGQIMGTMMGCSDTGKITKFVSATPSLLDYNGRMPIVVYVPDGYELKYKIYKAEPDTYQALQVLQKNK